jgi:hypothetical protein
MYLAGFVSRRRQADKERRAYLVALKHRDVFVQMLERLLNARSQIIFGDTVTKHGVEHVAEALVFARTSLSQISRDDLHDLKILPNRASRRIEKASAILRCLDKAVAKKSVNFALNSNSFMVDKQDVALFKSWAVPLGVGLELLSLANIELTKAASGRAPEPSNEKRFSLWE